MAAWNSANRPAAMTAIAVQKLARADSVSIGFIGCGVQARSLFDVLRLVLPDLKEVVACSRSAASAERFVAMVRGAGLVARTTLEPREAIEGLDVIITTVPEGAQVLEFLDTAWVTPGAFVGAVDLARSWKRGTLRAMDILATDEREQTRVLTASGRMTFAGPTKRISPIWRAAPSRGAVRRRNARCSISPVTRWPIWLWHRSSTRQRCGKAWVRGWRAELTVCFGSRADTGQWLVSARSGRCRVRSYNPPFRFSNSRYAAQTRSPILAAVACRVDFNPENVRSVVPSGIDR